MPVAISPEQIGAPPLDPPSKLWTRAECLALEDSGIFEGRRYELIEGKLIDKMGMKPPHALVLVMLLDWLSKTFGPQHIRPQLPIDVHPEDNPTSQPEPDFAVTTQPAPAFHDRLPQPSEIALVIEISDSTLAFDTRVKAGLYARAAISEFWVIDIPGRRILVHREPRDGAWQSLMVYAEDEPVSPLARPASAIRWRDLTR